MKQTQPTILVVDDEQNLAAFAQLAEQYLPQCRIMTASSSERGLRLAIEEPPDCALLDVHLPDVNGIALCRQLKENPVTACIPVILVTCQSTGPELRVRGLEAGADDFIAKPIDSIELAARIKVALRIKQAEDELREMNARLAGQVLQQTEALRESQSSFQTVSDGLPALIAHVGDDQRYRFANHAYAKWLGISPEQMIGRKVLEVWGKRAHPRVEERIESVLAGRRVSYEGSITLENGATRCYLAELIPQCSHDGKVIGYFVIAQDVTEQKEQQQKVLRLATAIEQAGEGFLLVDREHAIRYANPAFEKLTGHPLEEIRNESIRTILSPRHDDAFYREIFETVLAGETWIGTIEQLRRDGSACVTETTVSPVQDPSGALSDYVVIVRDVSKLASLEQQVRQMQKMEAIGTLAGGIAHDFNNILAPIIGYTEMMLITGVLDSRLQRYLGEVLKAALRARDLVQQILAFSRQAELERTPVRVSLIVKEALKLLRASVPSSIEIQARVAKDAEPLAVLADPTQIHQIVMNLCANARDAMQGVAGLMEVSLTCEEVEAGVTGPFRQTSPGSYVKLSVKDTGSGMDALLQTRIFEPYFTTKAPGKGTGMGLAVVYGIVKSLGGTISVESVQGNGTVFHVLFPCLRAKRESVEEAAAPLLTGNGHILLVDDEAMVVETTRRQLTRLGYGVTALTGAREALTAFAVRPEHFDLVMTDFTMPHMTGMELTRELLAIRPDIPIILCTGFSEDVSPEEAKAKGIREFLMKPLAIRQLAESLRRVL
ncbi:MAG: response regulator [Syntrophobacteraceae bacterium]